jgi:ubiquitin-conjugating enzyme E2 variant
MRVVGLSIWAWACSSARMAATVVRRSKVNMSCIDPRDGRVDPAKFVTLAQWRREYTLENVLTELRREMAQPHNRKLAQAPEGANF